MWARLGAELGVLGLSVPEADGGVGGTLVDQAVAVEEFGASTGLRTAVRHGVPGDSRAGRRPVGPARDELLADLIEGRRTAALAVVDRAGVFDPTAVAVTRQRR